MYTIWPWNVDNIIYESCIILITILFKWICYTEVTKNGYAKSFLLTIYINFISYTIGIFVHNILFKYYEQISILYQRVCEIEEINNYLIQNNYLNFFKNSNLFELLYLVFFVWVAGTIDALVEFTSYHIIEFYLKSKHRISCLFYFKDDYKKYCEDFENKMKDFYKDNMFDESLFYLQYKDFHLINLVAVSFQVVGIYIKNGVLI